MKILSFFLACLLLVSPVALPVLADEADVKESETAVGDVNEVAEEESAVDSAAAAWQINAKSGILIEAETGKVLWEQNADEPLPPASITKIMTLLLVMEALDEGKIKEEDTVVASENAASMGGSQIYLKAGEEMSVRDLLKAVAIASANDAAVALAEHIAGSCDAFVEKMNVRAAALGMQNARFENVNGLDDTTTDHRTSARDVALMSAALIAHPLILEYSGIWMDTVRDGAFTLTNTNRLVRFYPGATGLKTGSTSKAGYCLSATACRNGMHLIAVVMGAPTRDIRHEEAKKLLDFGFAQFAVYRAEENAQSERAVVGGTQDTCRLLFSAAAFVVPKGKEKDVVSVVTLPDSLSAPLVRGQQVGETVYTLDGEEVGRAPISAAETVDVISFWTLFLRIVKKGVGSSF